MNFTSLKYSSTYRQFLLLLIHECLINFMDLCIVLLRIQASQGVLNEKEPCWQVDVVEAISINSPDSLMNQHTRRRGEKALNLVQIDYSGDIFKIMYSAVLFTGGTMPACFSCILRFTPDGSLHL